MAKYHYVPQYTDAWDALRVGIPTSSGFENIITPLGKKTAKSRWQAYGDTLIAEKILKRRLDSYMSHWMEAGRMMELDAIEQYEMNRPDIQSVPVGFVTDDTEWFGCSPDRLINDDGLLEIKCPKPNTLIAYIRGEDISRDYYPQLQGQLFVTGRTWVDIYPYHPEIPARPLRVYRDDAYLALLAEYLGDFKTYMEDAIIKIAELTMNDDLYKKAA